MKIYLRKLHLTKIAISKLNRNSMVIIKGGSEFPCDDRPKPTSPQDKQCPQSVNDC